MNQSEINEIFDATIKRSRDVLCSKADEYVGQQGDRLSNFKHAAHLQNVKLPTALAGMLCKHTVSVYDMISRYESGESFSEEKWSEKITDHINYLILLQAVLAEERKSAPPPVRDKCIFCGVELSDSYVCLDCARKGITAADANAPPTPTESTTQIKQDEPICREVSRAAKVGEWIKVVDSCGEPREYQNGDIGQTVKKWDVKGGIDADINGFKSVQLYDWEYVVLEGYQS